MRRIDSRTLFLLFFSGIFYDSFFCGVHLKYPSQLLFAFVGCMGSDILFNYFRHRVWTFPLSGLVSTCGTFTIIASPVAWPYAISGFLSIYSKHFLRFQERHVFNPANFGSLLTLFYFRDITQSSSSSWSGNPWLIGYLWGLGIILVISARRWIVCLGYLAAFLAIDHFFLRYSLPSNIAAFAAPSFMLFVFFMISDPKTSPGSKLGQISYAVTIAAIETLFKYYRIPYTSLYALFFTCVIYNVLMPLSYPVLKNRFLPQPA